MKNEDYQKHLKEIDEFNRVQEKVKEQYNIESIKTQNQSIDFFGNNLLQPLLLCDHTILYLLLNITEINSIKNEKVIQKLHIVTAYVQSIDISTKLIIEGNYIKATATLKQDYEMMLRLNEIHTNRAKRGKTPNPQNGPKTFGEMYGYFNDIAHIAKNDILNIILKYETDQKLNGISPVKNLKKRYAHKLMAYNAAIKTEMLRQTLNLYFELAGENEIHRKSIVHYKIINDTYIQEGLFETE